MKIDLIHSLHLQKLDYVIISGDICDRPQEEQYAIALEFVESLWMNKNGSWRSTPLKKNRAVSKIELFMTDSEYARIRKMKDPIETLNRPEEHMTIYRSDGSFVSLKYENGRVTICDSREKNVRRLERVEHR